MGMAASQARFLGLTARKTDVEFQGQQVNQRRTQLSNESANLLRELLALDVPTPPSPVIYDPTSQQYIDLMTAYEYDKSIYDAEYDRINNEMYLIQESDRILEIQLKQLDTEQQAIQTEMDAVKKVIDKNVDTTFKTFA